MLDLLSDCDDVASEDVDGDESCDKAWGWEDC